MNDWRVPGFTSTGSKRPDALFGTEGGGGGPTRMTRAAGCRVWAEGGREYVDFIMALGSDHFGVRKDVRQRVLQFHARLVLGHHHDAYFLAGGRLA